MPPLLSWLEIDPQSHFSLANIPFGIISTTVDLSARVAIAIGDHVLDLSAFARGGGFADLPAIAPQHEAVFAQTTLNAFAALGRPFHRAVREYLQAILRRDGPFPSRLETNAELRSAALIPQHDCTTHLPMHIGDYTDFYAGRHHAYNVGVLFRGPANALQPNYHHLPVGYHGRSSSIVVSESPIRRPRGQILLDPTAEPKRPILSPSRKLDFELELGAFVCTPSQLGEPVSLADAPKHLFGLVLLNDWSARDIQTWENVPLGPFASKNFATSISPWVVLMDALAPFAAAGLPNDEIELLPYLHEREDSSALAAASHYDISLSVALTTNAGDTTVLTRTAGTNLLFSFPQMLAHHTVGGCPMRVGDLLGSGTISGAGPGEQGALLELTRGGREPVALEGGGSRAFLEDGDVLVLSGVCGSEDYGLVGFGECVGRVEPAVAV